MEEQEIIRLCKERNPLGQKELVYQYSKVLMSQSFRYTLSKDDSKDILQDTFIQVFQKIDSFDPTKGPLIPWLKKVSLNITLMKLRKQKRLTTNKDNYSSYQEIQGDYQLVDTSLEAKDLYNIVLQLPQQQRLVFNLFAIEGYSHQEIATKMEITTSHSRTVLTRARKKLKDIINTRNTHKISYYDRS